MAKETATNKPRNHQSEATRRAKRARAKGSSFERECLRFFNDWTGYAFSRTPSSGAGLIKGDLMPEIGTPWPFLVECKNVEAFNIGSFWTKKGAMWNAWTKAVQETPDTHNTLLMFRSRQCQPMMICYASTLVGCTNLKYSDLNVQNFSSMFIVPTPERAAKAKARNEFIIGVRLEDMLRWSYRKAS